MSDRDAYALGWCSAGGSEGAPPALEPVGPGDAAPGGPGVEAQGVSRALEVVPASVRRAFVRGVVDARGAITSPGGAAQSPRVTVALDREEDRRALRAAVGLAAHDTGAVLLFEGHNAFELLALLYEGDGPALVRSRELYRRWAGFVPAGPVCVRYRLLEPAAVAPFKARASDSGYDLTLIRVARVIGSVTLYGTGVAVEPSFGYYLDVVPRSSIIKTGYMLANGVGVIDRTYRGEISVPLIKVDPSAPDLPLPSRVVQMIPRPIVHAELARADVLEDTHRGADGFGSTG